MKPYFVFRNGFLGIGFLLAMLPVFAQRADLKQPLALNEKLISLRKSGYDHIRQQQYDQAVLDFSSGLALSGQNGMDSFVCAFQSLLGTAYRYKGKYDSAFFFLGLAKKVAEKKKFINLQAFVQIESFAIYNKNGTGDSITAVVQHMKELIPGLDSLGSEHAKIEMYLGHNDKHKAKYRESLEHYYTALRLFIHLKDSANEGIIYVSIANVLELLGEQNKALEYHEQATRLFNSLGRKFELLIELLNITDLYTTSGQLDSAEKYIRQAQLIAEAMSDKSYLGNVNIDLGIIYQRRNQFREANAFFLQAVHYSILTLNDINLMNAYQGLGELFMAEHEPQQAAPYLEKHLALARAQNDKEEIMEAIKNLAENENVLRHFDKAYAWQKMYNVYKDSAYTSSTAKSMAEMDSKYQAEKKEIEIGLLKKDQQLDRLNLQKQKNFKWGAIIVLLLLSLIAFLMINRFRILQKSKRLIEMERMRNTIARDLHDDIGSTLSSIHILSNVALQQPDGGNNAMGNSMLKIKDRSAAIMENMSDIVWAINPRHDSVEQMIIRMKEFSAEILEPLRIDYIFREEGDFFAIKLDIHKRKDFYLLFKEAINNAAKYSHCKNISILLKQDTQWLHLGITDDGCGFDVQAAGRGNGLINMHSRAVAMQADLKINSVLNEGTTINVKVPIT